MCSDMWFNKSRAGISIYYLLHTDKMCDSMEIYPMSFPIILKVDKTMEEDKNANCLFFLSHYIVDAHLFTF